MKRCMERAQQHLTLAEEAETSTKDSINGTLVGGGKQGRGLIHYLRTS